MRKAGWTQVRSFARHLAGGEGATFDEIEAWRRPLVRWLSWNDERGMSREYAELIAKELGTNPERYLSTQYDESRQLERKIRRLESQSQELQAQLARHRQRKPPA